MEFTGIRMQIGEVLKTHNIEFKEVSPSAIKKVYMKVIKIFDDIPDIREKTKIVYTLDSLILMIFLATLCGSDACTEYEIFWKHNHKLYKKIFGMELIPSHDTFRRILGLIDSEILNTIIVSAIESSDATLRKVMKVPKPKMVHICVDGKEERSTGREDTMHGEQKRRQILNFYECNNETCLRTDPIDEKTNEIPHAQKILSGMDLRNTVISADALHTQVKTAGIIADKKGDYLFGLKGNQKTLYETTISIFSEERLKNLHGTKDYCYNKEIAHGQLEEREYYLYLLTPSLKKTVFADWKKVNAVVYYKKHTIKNLSGEENEEIRYYLTSLKDVNDAALIIRNHWSVENKLHWNLDTVLGEDMMALTDKTAVANKSIINKMCLALYSRIQQMTEKKDRISKRSMRKGFGWAFEDMMKQALIMLDPAALKKCLTITTKK